MSKRLQGFLLVIGVLLLLAAMVGLAKHKTLNDLLTTRPKLVTVNLREALSIPMALAAKHLTPAEQADFAKRYSAILPQVIHAYANAHHVTVIAVTTLADPNGLDRTDILMQQAIQQTKRGEVS